MKIKLGLSLRDSPPSFDPSGSRALRRRHRHLVDRGRVRRNGTTPKPERQTASNPDRSVNAQATKGRLGRSSSHQKAILANATSCSSMGGSRRPSEGGRASAYAEKLITHAKKARCTARVLKSRDRDVVHTLFAEIGPFADRDGGTISSKSRHVRGDNALRWP